MNRIAVFPRDPNPYQDRFHAALARTGWRTRYLGQLTPSRTLNLLLLPLELLAERARGTRVLHLHWLHGFSLPWAGPVLGPILAHVWFRLVFALAGGLGLRRVWTVHNVLPHAPVLYDDLAGRQTLARGCDLVLAHSDLALAELRRIGAAPRRGVVIPHGPLRSVDAAALRSPGSGDGRRTVLFFGRVDPYKGVEDLLSAVERLDPELGLRVVVAGACADEELRARLLDRGASLGARVDLRLQRIPDDELETLFAAADAVVLPFRRITTSGSLLDAMLHGRVVVVPEIPLLVDGLPRAAIHAYDGSIGGLAAALAAIAQAPAADLASGGRAAAAYAGSRDWGVAAQRVAGALQELDRHDAVARPPARETVAA